MCETNLYEQPDDLKDAAEVGLDLIDGLRQETPVGSDAHVGHPVDGDQTLHQAAQRVEGGVTCLEGNIRVSPAPLGQCFGCEE